jgi:hypothetical protein
MSAGDATLSNQRVRRFILHMDGIYQIIDDSRIEAAIWRK